MYDMKIGTAQHDDLPDLLMLYRTLHPGEADLALNDAADILESLSRFAGSAVFVARWDTRLVSTATLVVIPNLTRNGAPYGLIENVVTEPAYRQRGLAGRLIQQAISVAWAQGCYKVMLMSGAKDPAVLRFYANLGFEQSKTGFEVRRLAVRQG